VANVNLADLDDLNNDDDDLDDFGDEEVVDVSDEQRALLTSFDTIRHDADHRQQITDAT
jgi:hypothetical protein